MTKKPGESLKKYLGGSGNFSIPKPLSFLQKSIARIIELGIKSLWTEMKLVSKEEEEIEVKGRYYKFVRFRRIKEIKIEFEEL